MALGAAPSLAVDQWAWATGMGGLSLVCCPLALCAGQV
jgi:hypothetical protein